MPDRKVIYDSEDEDAGLSPFNSPSKGDATNAEVELDNERDTRGDLQQGLDISEMRSTDPDFFRNVYDEQQNAATEVIPDSARDGNGDVASSDRQKSSGRNTKDNSSSITDPILKRGRKVQKANRVDKVDLGNLTQVTTPRDTAPGALSRNIYDFPSSDGETSATKGRVNAKKTRGMRKRGQAAAPGKAAVSPSPAQLSSPDGRLMPTHTHEEDEALRPTRKKRNGGSQRSRSQVSEDVDLLVIPRTADVDDSPSGMRVGSEDPPSLIPDTLGEEQGISEHPPASFFIAPPSRLTASQKQEYERIRGSSEHERDENHHISLPVPQGQTQTQNIHSSEATIAYPTPSRYNSSATQSLYQHETGNQCPSNTTASNRKRAKIIRTGNILPHSSPDELNSHSPSRTLIKTKRREDKDEDDELAQNDSWDSDNIGFQREQYVPRQSRRRGGIESYEGLGTPALVDADAGSTSKKRLRTERLVDEVQEDSWKNDQIGAYQEDYEPKPRLTRSKAVVQEDAEESAPEQLMPDTCPPDRAGSGDMESAEPILISSGQQTPQEGVEVIEGIDPDYLAALPKDLRQEVISDHLARNLQASRTRGRGRPNQLLNAPDAPTEQTAQPKRRGRKRKEPMNEEVMNAAQDDEAQATPASIAPAKKKRGRPRKSETVQAAPIAAADEDISLAYEVEDIPQAVEDPIAEDTQPAESVKEAPMSTKAQSKRGRKKKTVEEPPIALEEPSEHVQAISETSKAPSKRGRKKKAVEEPAANVSDELQEEEDAPHDLTMEVEESSQLPSNKPGESVQETDTSRMPLENISGNTASFKGIAERDAGGQKEVTPEAKVNEIPKSASSTTGQGQGKVPLRVGLSKRTRIAPLLKIIRK